jgi:hypothetical protein
MTRLHFSQTINFVGESRGILHVRTASLRIVELETFKTDKGSCHERGCEYSLSCFN